MTASIWNPGTPAGADSSTLAYLPEGTGAVETTVQAKLRESISAKDFGALGNGAADDTSALQSLAAYVNSIPNLDRWPVEVVFSKGVYIYTTTLAFTRPVVLIGEEGATLYFTGTGAALSLGPDNLVSSVNVPLNAEYTVDGIRFQSGDVATYGIYINEFITEPRIRNCTFIDFGNTTAGSYCIFGRYSNWNALIENTRYLCLNKTGTGLHFICFPGLSANPGSGPPYAIDPLNSRGYDAGNSRVTIRDCFMTNYSSQQLGFFAYLSGVKSRIVGGGFQWSNYGIFLGGFASDTHIDSVYCEIDSGITNPYFITCETTSTSDPLTFMAEAVTVSDAYINLHEVSAARVIYTADASMKFKNWTVSAVVTSATAGHSLFTQSDITGQLGNFADIKRNSNDSTPSNQVKLHATYANAEPWCTPGGTNIETVGDAVYTLTQTDLGKTKVKTGTTARNWTLPSDTTSLIEVGASIEVLHAGTVANLSLIADGGVTVILAGTVTTGTRTLAPGALAICKKTAANTWRVSGPGVT